MLIKKSEIYVESWCPISTKEYPSFVEKVKFIRRHKLAFYFLNEETKSKTLYNMNLEEIKNAYNQAIGNLIGNLILMYIAGIPISMASSCAYMVTLSENGFNMQDFAISISITPLFIVLIFIPAIVPSSLSEIFEEKTKEKGGVKQC